MKNRITYVSQADTEKIKQKIILVKKTFIVEIEGKKNKCLSDYLLDISLKFKFPTIARDYAVYDDWLCDLTWIDEPNIAIFIYNFRDFMYVDLDAKNTIMKKFEREILPWWESEVCRHVVEGKARSFMVYLIE